jgi:hypothetical protein
MSTQDFSIGFADGATTSFSSGWGATTTTGGGSSGFSISSSKGSSGAGIRADAAALERAIRPFESPRILALRARRLAREEDTTDQSIIRWGKPYSPGSATQTAEEDKRGFQIVNPKPPPKSPTEQRQTRVYSEVSRVTETVRVTNPNDSNQYVDVARIRNITFRGPDGIDVRFELNPPA